MESEESTDIFSTEVFPKLTPIIKIDIEFGLLADAFEEAVELRQYERIKILRDTIYGHQFSAYHTYCSLSKLMEEYMQKDPKNKSLYCDLKDLLDSEAERKSHDLDEYVATFLKLKRPSE